VAPFLNGLRFNSPQACLVNIGHILLADTRSVLLPDSSLFLTENKISIESNSSTSFVSHAWHKF